MISSDFALLCSRHLHHRSRWPAGEQRARYCTCLAIPYRVAEGYPAIQPPAPSRKGQGILDSQDHASMSALQLLPHSRSDSRACEFESRFLTWHCKLSRTLRSESHPVGCDEATISPTTGESQADQRQHGQPVTFFSDPR